MKVLISGASGYLANEIIRILQKNNIHVVAMSSSKLTHNGSITKEGHFETVLNESVFKGDYKLDKVDYVINTAFCRKSEGKKLIDSLDFLRRLTHVTVDAGVTGFVNISSQSVYGSVTNQLFVENDQLNPEYLYSFAKASSEMILQEIIESNHSLMKFTNIRLASLIGPGKAIPQNILYKFIVSALNKERIEIIDGKQKFSFLDVRDAAEGIYRFIVKNPAEWNRAYNLGPESQINLLELVRKVKKVVEYDSGIKVEYDVVKGESYINTGIDSRQLYTILNWKPNFDFERTVRDTLVAIQEQEHKKCGSFSDGR